MIQTNALVIYKNKPALVKEQTDGKYTVSLQDNTQVKVRDKDIELIHQGPVKNFGELKSSLPEKSAIHEAWELFSSENTPVSLKDIASLIFGEYTPSSAYAAFLLLQNGLYFTGSPDSIVPRSKEEITAEEAKRSGKEKETNERVQFLERLKSCLKKPAENSLMPEDLRFMQDVEALSLGKTAKSRTMKDLGLEESPQEAHALLLKTGFWTQEVNPHPSRFGVSLNSVSICPDAPGNNEERRDLCHLASFAIDSPWSGDPDDAVSIETDENGNSVLYVHVSDPASSVMPDTPAEKEARDRGATLYLPENIVRMLAPESLPMFALGLCEKSIALTFKMTLDKDCKIINTEIFPSVVKVSRLTYEQADSLSSGSIFSKGSELSEESKLCALQELASRNYKRRTAQGAVNIELPEVHVSLENGFPKIEQVIHYRSVSLVRECMILACEAAGSWAAGNGIPFPYVSQEVELQGKVPGGMSGSYQLRRCMRPRILSTKPGLHQGLGLDVYSQVTSPLRRYTDLLAHMQIRAFLRGDKPLSADEVSSRLGFSEAGVVAAVQAERATNNHWTMVYLADKKDSVWEAVALEKKGNRWALMIPSLALETQVALQKDVPVNTIVKLALKSVNIPRGEAVFVHG